MNDLSNPLSALKEGHWFKLICGASFQDLPAIRSLTLAYSLAGADCIDVAADPAVISAAQEALTLANSLGKIAQNKGYPYQGKPWLMVSLNDGEDPHFRKAEFEVSQCPTACHRPCETICPAQAITFSDFRPWGILEDRCYGCGRCVPVCPSQLITTRSYLSSPTAIAPLIEAGQIQALEIHTQVGHQEAFKRLWQAIAPYIHYLKVLAISCQDDSEVKQYLEFLSEIIAPLPCPLIWQTDGRPMSGDIGKGTTHPAIKMAQKVLSSGLPGYIQLAGGTNDHTVKKLRQMGLLRDKKEHLISQGKVSGIAYGSYARSLMSPILNQLENLAQPESNLENCPELLWKAVKKAYTLIYPLKSPDWPTNS